MIYDRIEAVRELLEEEKLDAVLVNKEVNLHYFSGFTGDSTFLVISRQKAFLVTDFRYTEQAVQQCPEYEIVEQTDGLLTAVAELSVKEGYKKVGFEGGALIYDAYAALQRKMSGISLTKSVKLDELRAVKEDEEIQYIRKAVSISDKAFAEVLSYLRSGLKEKEVAAFMENAMRVKGSERPAFTTIVASGKRGSLPHGTASDKVIEKGDLVTMDFGAVYKGYHSDITRTVCVGWADDIKRNIYNLVLKGQLLGVSKVRPGVSGKSVDLAVRKCFDEEGGPILADMGLPVEELDSNGKAVGMSRYFGHGLGHSLGLEIHEEPRLSRFSKCKSLPINTLITVEPGIYIPDWGGVRIEDTVLVTEDGREVLTKSPKQLIEL